MEASARLSAQALDDVVVVEVRADADPTTLVARLGDDSHLVLRGTGERETRAWRAVRVADPGSSVPAINPEAWFSHPLPDGPFEELRWICLTLEDISDALGDRVHTMPGRPMSDETEDLGQGETRRVQRLAWRRAARYPGGYDGSPRDLRRGDAVWTHRHGLLMGLAEDSACMLDAMVRANEEPFASVLLSAPGARLDRALETLST